MSSHALLERLSQWTRLDRGVLGCVRSKKMVFSIVVRFFGTTCFGSAEGSKMVGVDNESNQVSKGHSVDALALRGDEGRGTLR